MSLGTFANAGPPQWGGFNTQSVHAGARNMIASRGQQQGHERAV
jgi:hypothetical protein